MRSDECRIRIAAAGDIHYGERADDRERAHAAFAALEGRADVILLAGDLTTHGEPEQAGAFLGPARLAPPILEHNPDMVLRGHADAGTFEGRLGEVPVYIVSVPVMGEDFWVFGLAGERRRVPSEIH